MVAANEVDIEAAAALAKQLTPKQMQIYDIISKAKPGSLTLIGYGGAAGGGKGSRWPDRAVTTYNENMETNVLTPNGFVFAQDLAVGSQVCNPDGTIATVIGIYPRGLQQFYRVTFADGASVECDGDHLWGVRDRNARKRRKVPLGPIPPDLSPDEDWNYRYFQRYTVMSTTQAMERIANGHNLCVPLPAPQAFSQPPGRWPVLPPYTMGVLLGDGTFGSGIYWMKPDRFIADEITKEIEPFGLVVSDHALAGSHGIVQPAGMPATSAHKLVERVGLLGKRSWEKFVPQQYKMLPAEGRRSLLQGLMDTDGYCDERGHVEYVSTSAQLALDVQWLLRSLGYTASIAEKLDPKYAYKGEEHTGRKAYRLYVRGNNMPDLFRLPRKRDRCRERIGVGSGANGHDLWVDNPIVSIEPTIIDECACIAVDNPNGLYVTDDFIVTHNTRLLVELAKDYMLDYPGCKIMVGRKDFKDLRTTTMEQFDMHVPPQLIVGRNNAEHWRDIRLPEWPPGVSSRVEFRELKDFLGIASEEWQAAFVDEAAEVPKKTALMLLLRLRRNLPDAVMQTRKSKAYPDGKPPKFLMVCASNPWPGWFESWFVKREMDEDLMRAYNGTLHFVQALPGDNPFLPKDYAQRMLASNMPQDWVNRMLLGKWDAFVGQVYPQFSPFIHEWRAPAPAPENVKRILGGLDFGGQNPHSHFSAGMVALLTNSNRLIRVAEFEDRGPGIVERQLQWMISQQHLWCGRKGSKISSIHWCADKSQMVAIEMWRKMGMMIQPSRGGNNSVEVGIASVGRRLDRDQSGLPGSFYMPGVEKFPERMREYRYEDVGDESHPTRRYPIKVNDDLCFSAETLVLTPTGEREIASLAAGDEVVGADGYLTIVTRSWMVAPFAITVSVLMETGQEIIVTPDQQFWTEHGWRRARDLRAGERVVATDTSGYHGEHGYFANTRTPQWLSLPPIPRVFPACFTGVLAASREGRCSLSTQGSMGECPWPYCSRLPYSPRRSRSRQQCDCQPVVLNCQRTQPPSYATPDGCPARSRPRQSGQDSATGVGVAWHGGGEGSPSHAGSIVQGLIEREEQGMRDVREDLCYGLGQGVILLGILQDQGAQDSRAGHGYQALHGLRGTQNREQVRHGGLVQTMWTVASVRPSSPRAVYDITVADPRHAFYANGMLVRNCDADRYLHELLDAGAGSPNFLRRAIPVIR